MSKILDEGNLKFDFTAYDTVEKFDDKNKKAHGLQAVDFIAETQGCLYFIEVKDFQNPGSPPNQRKKDIKKLRIDKNKNKQTKASVKFSLEMGGKIKDSLLRQYAEGYKFQKKVMYLLIINLNRLGSYERIQIYGKGGLSDSIKGHVPTGLNDNTRFGDFTEISFNLIIVDLAKAGQSQTEKDIIVQRIL